MSDADPVLARFARPATERRTRLAVLSDLHLSLDEEGTWRVSHRTEQRLDAVLFDGDLVQSGSRAEFAAFDRLADAIDEPFFAVPGNHDLIAWGEDADDRFTLPAFEDRYAPDGELPFHVRVGGVDLVGLNSNSSTRDSVTDTYEGSLSPETLDWLDGVLADADCPLVAVHHTLDAVRDHYLTARERLPIENGGSPGFENAGDLVAVLDDHDAPLVLTGHLHFPAVAQAGSVSEFTLPSLGPFPCGYTVFEVDERGTTARFRSVTDFEGTVEALGYGLDNDRVLLAAARMANLPIVDETGGTDD